MVEDKFKRKPYIEKFIKGISPNDFQVSVSGVIVSKAEGSFLLDDGTGQIQISSTENPNYEYLRVFGKVMPLESGLEIQAEIIQDISSVDKAIYKKIKELLSETQ